MDKLKITFIALMALIGSAVVLLLGISIGAGAGGDLEFTSDSISSWVSALATISIALLTIFLAKETWALRQFQIQQIEKIRKDSIKPSISVVLEVSKVGFNFLNVKVRNSGKGLAQNIKFSFINRNSASEELYQHVKDRFEEITFFKSGISNLCDGESKHSFFISFFELQSKFKTEAFDLNMELHVTYEDSEGENYRSKSQINFSEYMGMSELGGADSLYLTVKVLEKIEKHIGRFASGFKRLNVNTYSKKDRELENEEDEERMTAHIQRMEQAKIKK